MTFPVHEALHALLVPASELRPHPDNPRNGDVDAISASMLANGVYRPVYAQRSTGRVLAGNHTYAAMLAAGHTEVPCVWLDVDDNTARRILLADNRTADMGSYDEALLVASLTALDGDLAGTGYTETDLAALEEALASLDDDPLGAEGDNRAPTTGEQLAIADVTVGEPKHQPAHRSVWNVGEHLLVVARLLDEHDAWASSLDGRVFVPYPEPYIVTATIAQEKKMLLVQPNRYLAGHLLDKAESIGLTVTEQPR